VLKKWVHNFRGEYLRKQPLGGFRRIWEDNMKMDIREGVCEDGTCMNVFRSWFCYQQYSTIRFYYQRHTSPKKIVYYNIFIRKLYLMNDGLQRCMCLPRSNSSAMGNSLVHGA
jgi:hypothetical protein